MYPSYEFIKSLTCIFIIKMYIPYIYILKETDTSYSVGFMLLFSAIMKSYLLTLNCDCFE